MYRRVIVTATVAFLLAALAACGGESTGPGSDDDDGNGDLPGEGHVINLQASSFSPSNLTIDAGETVRWYNASGIFHSITPDNPDQTGVWGGTATSVQEVALTHTFDVPGEVYKYHCTAHRGMVGTITVRAQE